VHESRPSTGRSGILFATLLTTALVAAACGGGNTSTSSTTTATSAPSSSPASSAPTSTTTTVAPTPGGKLIVRVEAEVANPWTPAGMQCDTSCQTRARSFFETLMLNDSSGTPQPFLAQAVTHSDDYKTWTVKLRTGISFTDGTPFNADAVIDNVNRVRKSFLLGAALTNLAGTKKIDDATVEFDMQTPWVDFDRYMTNQYFFEASSTWLAAVDKDPTQATKPIGTGPFVLTSYTPGDTTIVRKNPGYWRKSEGLPYLDEIDFRVVTDELTAANATKSGQLDVLVTDNGQNIKDFKSNKSFSYTEQKLYGESTYLLLNLSQPILQDQNIRCGLTAATNTKTLTDALTQGQFAPANGPFAPGQQGYLDDNGNQRYDPAMAKQLIKAWSDAHGGQKPKVVLTTTTDSTTQQEGQLLQQWWSEAGVDVQLVAIEQSKLITDALLGDPSFMAFAWRNNAGNVFEQQYIWWSSTTALPPGQLALNFGRLKDPLIDQLLNDARSNPDPAAQKKDAEDANRQFAKQCWLVPTWWPTWAVVAAPKVQGIGTTTFPAGQAGTALDGAGFPGQVFWTNVWVKK
jgi:4-phytase/acid phosphatase/peptide/nickel transport system substrate-binding protein